MTRHSKDMIEILGIRVRNANEPDLLERATPEEIEEFKQQLLAAEDAPAQMLELAGMLTAAAYSLRHGENLRIEIQLARRTIH